MTKASYGFNLLHEAICLQKLVMFLCCCCCIAYVLRCSWSLVLTSASYLAVYCLRLFVVYKPVMFMVCCLHCLAHNIPMFMATTANIVSYRYSTHQTLMVRSTGSRSKKTGNEWV